MARTVGRQALGTLILNGSRGVTSRVRAWRGWMNAKPRWGDFQACVAPQASYRDALRGWRGRSPKRMRRLEREMVTSRARWRA
jgi:hypothetical protein